MTTSWRVSILGILTCLASAPMASAEVVPKVGTRGSSAFLPDSRIPSRTTDGSGLVGEAHGILPGGAMWLTADGDFAPTIEFDLGAVYRIGSMRVWNYNEATNGLMSRGVATATIEVATEQDDYTAQITDQTFMMAPGTETDFSETIDLGDVEARFVRLSISANHGDPSFTGLSEVQFDAELVDGQIRAIDATVSEVSSTIAGFNRLPQYLLDSSGLFGTTHSIIPDGTMWLAASGDINPSITFDLGFVREIDRMVVWNYNEWLEGRDDLLVRGISSADIQISENGTDFVDYATDRQFPIAPGDQFTPFAETIDFDNTPARFVRLNVNSNHGDATFTGLSEVQFFGSSTDTDGDGLPDGWERQFADTLDELNGLGAGPGPGAGTGDFDGDGLTDRQEFDLSQGAYPGISPIDADSDDDTLSDGAEIAGAGDRPPTSPVSADTDNDGLSDAVESNTGTFVNAEDTGTNPILADTDGDRFADAFEIAEGTDPLDADSFPVPDVVGLWTFEADSPIQPDLSPFANDATVGPGASWMADPDRGGVMDFDGNESLLEVDDSDSLSITGDITIAAWVKSADYISGNGFRSIVGKTQNNLPAPYDLYLLVNEGLPRFYIGDGAQSLAQGTGTAAPPAGEWHHVAVSRSGNVVTHYLNGEFNGEAVVVATMVDLDGPLYIGNRADLFTDMLGQLDDVAIFNGAVAPAAIMEIMNGDFSRFGISTSTVLFQITSIVRDEATGNVTLEWPSRPGANYAVDVSQNLMTWSELTDNVASEGESTSFVDTLFAPQATGSIFYRVRRM